MVQILKGYHHHMCQESRNYLSATFDRTRVAILKVPSGQIGSKWEWYHWKALEKDINRYKFLIFYSRSWIF